MPANHHPPSPDPANPSQPSSSARTRTRKYNTNKLPKLQLKDQPTISNYFKMKVTQNPEPDGTPPRPGEQHSKCDSWLSKTFQDFIFIQMWPGCFEFYNNTETSYDK